MMAESLFLVIVVVMTLSTFDAKHWPDFSCTRTSKHQFKKIPLDISGWAGTAQECDKMCVLRKRDVVIKSKKDEPFRFDIEAFITLMLNELGYEDEHRKEAPQKLVDEVTAKLQICKTKHREFETMTNVRYLPCEPYKDLFTCVHNATGCSGDSY